MYILVKNPDMAEMLYLDFFIFFKTFLQIALSVIVDAFVTGKESCIIWRVWYNKKKWRDDYEKNEEQMETDDCLVYGGSIVMCELLIYIRSKNRQ